MKRATQFGLALLLVAGPLSAAVGRPPVKWSPVVYRGETRSEVVTWCSGVTEAQCAAGLGLVNLTGYSAKLQIRDVVTNLMLLELTDGSGITLGGVAGTITVALTPAQTLALPLGAQAFDLRMTSGTGQVTYLLAGYVQVKETRTR